jgi:hypothetical protein
MKKLNYLAIATMAISMVACSSDDNLASNDGNAGGDVNGLDAIELSVSNPSTMISAKGTGVVGGISTESNVWKNEQVNIYMLEKGTMNLAYFNSEDKDAGNPIFGGSAFITPNVSASGIANTADGSIKYYPPTGMFDFWGYRLDDCAQEAAVTTEEQISINFTLDGSQDIMVGKAVPAQTGPGTPGARAYSAYAARNGVQPEISFKHLLTRLTFQTTPSANAQSVCDDEVGVYIEKVSVKAKNKGTLLVACKDESKIGNGQLQMSDAEAVEIFLKDATKTEGKLNDLVPIHPKWDNVEDKPDTIDVGESVMIPAADKYELVFYLKQKVNKGNNVMEDVRYEMPWTLDPSTSDSESLSDKTKFLPGHSYNVLVTISGLKEIQVTTTLEPWIDGGTISINPEDQE